MVTVTIPVPAPVTGISEANGINNAGAVVGQEDTVFPFVWNPAQPNGTTGTPTRLAILPTGGGPSEATAFAINNIGDIVGSSDALDANGSAVTRAVLWSGTTVRDLGTLIPDPFNPGAFLGNSRAIDINDAGLIVGASDTAFGVEHAFLFDPATNIMRDLFSLVPPTALPGTADPSRATSINTNGDIVGVAAALDAAGNIVERAFLLPAGAISMIDLGTLIPDPNTSGAFLGNSGAFGVNDNGTIIGTSETSASSGGATLTGAVQFSTASPPIGLLPMQSDGFDVGPNNHVVGNHDIPPKGFVLHATTGLVDLTALAATAGMSIIGGTGVNAAGQITALAEMGGNTVGVLITP
jgi:probable HAF family extracellular repeat protein